MSVTVALEKGFSLHYPEESWKLDWFLDFRGIVWVGMGMSPGLHVKPPPQVSGRHRQMLGVSILKVEEDLDTDLIIDSYLVKVTDFTQQCYRYRACPVCLLAKGKQRFSFDMIYVSYS